MLSIKKNHKTKKKSLIHRKSFISTPKSNNNKAKKTLQYVYGSTSRELRSRFTPTTCHWRVWDAYKYISIYFCIGFCLVFLYVILKWNGIGYIQQYQQLYKHFWIVMRHMEYVPIHKFDRIGYTWMSFNWKSVRKD